jgi:hypothetical protein
MKFLPLSLLVLLFAFSASADPLGPNVRLPGFDLEQSRMVRDEASRILGDAQRRFGPGLGIKTLTGRALTCGLATFMQGVIEAAAFQQGAGLSPAQTSGARKAIDYLRDVQAKNCDRPSGGALGTGNEGDKIAKAFYDAHAPQARSTLDEVRERLGVIFSADAARLARDAMLAAAMVAAGLVLAPILGT